jgi:hypothetical protein
MRLLRKSEDIEMRKLLVLVVLALAFSVGASASFLPCPVTPPGPAVDVITTIGYGCTAGTLTFSNFSAVAATNGFVADVMLVSSSVDAAGTVYLNFNPTLNANQDIWFYFTVSGGLTGVDLGVGGNNGFATEVVCSAPVIIGGINNNMCPVGTELARFSAVSGHTADVSFPQGVYTAYVFKDVGVNQGEMSSLNQSFHVPEPMTFVLIGTGLVGLGLIRRRARKN